MAISQFPSKDGIPSGNTASRPSNPVIGDTYYNGQLIMLEIYDGTDWQPCSAVPSPAVLNSVTDVGGDLALNNASLTFAFTPATVGGAATGFSIYWNGALITSAASSPVTITGLAGGVSASGYVVANSEFGNSAVSNALTQTPTSVPDVPTAVTATSSDPNTTVSWTAPANNGGKAISLYTVTRYVGASAQTSSTTTSTSLTFTTPSPGSYTFKVKATNANGIGLESAASSSYVVPLIVEYLVAAGGAGGRQNWGGGGGAGFASASNFSAAMSTDYTVTIGGGGGSGSGGSDSTFANITNNGGGTGGNEYGGGSSGGCGGGGGRNGSGGTGNQGGNGGNGAAPTSGGGGGAGGAGASGNNINGGAGGIGITSNITGNAITLAGGGGGMAGYQTGGVGGTGTYGGGTGGGAPSGDNYAPAIHAAVNRGGGGGGGANSSSYGGSGGSGVVRLKYPNTSTITIGAGLTGTTAASGNNTVATITAGTGNVSWA